MGGGESTAIVERDGSAMAELPPGAVVASPHETTATAVAVTARALVEARYVMALKRPRNWDDVRERVLHACKRTRFAEAALYAKPVGNKRIRGLSVRFAEEAVRAMGNIDVATPIVFDDSDKTIVRVTVTDLEANAVYSADVTVPKTVERRELKQGQAALSVRTNSTGHAVYTVKATDDDIANKTNALVSKSLRNQVLRLLPADIQEEARDMISTTLNAEAKQDPDAARKRIADAFADMNVKVAALEELLGHELATAQPSEIEELRGIYQAIRDGETTWHAVISEHRDAEPKQKPKPKSKSKGAADLVAAAAAEAAAENEEREPGEEG